MICFRYCKLFLFEVLTALSLVLPCTCKHTSLIPWLYYSARWVWHNASSTAGIVPAVGNSRWDTAVIWSRLPPDEMRQREYTIHIENIKRVTTAAPSLVSACACHFADQRSPCTRSLYIVIKFDVRLITTRTICNNYRRQRQDNWSRCYKWISLFALQIEIF